jgi:hypothetical protein
MALRAAPLLALWSFTVMLLVVDSRENIVAELLPEEEIVARLAATSFSNDFKRAAIGDWAVTKRMLEEGDPLLQGLTEEEMVRVFEHLVVRPEMQRVLAGDMAAARWLIESKTLPREDVVQLVELSVLAEDINVAVELLTVPDVVARLRATDFLRDLRLASRTDDVVAARRMLEAGRPLLGHLTEDERTCVFVAL